MPLQVDELEGLPFTKDLKPVHLELLAENGTRAEFSPGAYIFKEDEPARRFYLVLKGKVAIGTFVSGRGFTTIQTLGDKEVVGWSWLIPPYQWRFSALVVLPTKVIEFDGQKLREACEADHSFGYMMLQRIAFVLGQRLEETRQRLEV